LRFWGLVFSLTRLWGALSHLTLPYLTLPSL
jgi:hypothetical protein